jgi:galactose mutarotase-like enzyme
MPSPIRIGNDHLTVDVSSLGAEMQSLTTSDGRSWLWNGDAAFWGGRSPVLFPIVGKAPDDKVTIDGVIYGMGQHGFARRSEFALTESTANTCLHRLVASEATKAVYPFDFQLTLQHVVDGRTLTVTAEVTNLDDKPMPFGIGFHPAFVWPLPGATGAAHVVTLDNKAEPQLQRLQGGLLSPDQLASPFAAGRLVLDHAMFDQDAMIFPQGAGTGLTYSAEGGPEMRFSFHNLPNLALWTKPGAPFICIEPWHGMAAEIGVGNDLAKRPYTETLAPSATASYGFSVEFPG